MATKRSLPTPRNEGMTNIISATLQLLKTHSPQDITLRDVAAVSGHAPRLIIEWFGGKGGLYAAVFTEIFTDLIESGELFAADVPTRKDVKIAFQLFNYMLLHHPDFVEEARSSLVMDVVMNQIVNVLGKTPEEAAVATRRLVVATLGIAIFQEFFGMSDDEAIKMVQDEFKSTTGMNMPAHPVAVNDLADPARDRQ